MDTTVAVAILAGAVVDFLKCLAGTALDAGAMFASRLLKSGPGKKVAVAGAALVTAVSNTCFE